MMTYREDRWDKKPTIHRYLVEQLSDGMWLIGTISYDDIGSCWKPLGKKKTWEEAMALVNLAIKEVENTLIRVNINN